MSMRNFFLMLLTILTINVYGQSTANQNAKAQPAKVAESAAKSQSPKPGDVKPPPKKTTNPIPKRHITKPPVRPKPIKSTNPPPTKTTKGTPSGESVFKRPH